MIDILAKNFEYDGEFLNDKGYIICRTDTPSDFETIDSDSQKSFSTASLNHGKSMDLLYSSYEDRIEISFCICKFSCDHPDPSSISLDESRAIKRWLNRPTFHKFKLIQPEWFNIYMEGSFNVQNIEVMGKVYLLELTFISNRPFALHEPITYKFSTTAQDNEFLFFDLSDEIGYIYPTLKIKCLQNGNLEITNSAEDRHTVINNCSEGEVITFSPELIMNTSKTEHVIQNDFNYQFFRISNSYRSRKNLLTFSMPVEAEITYSPYVKAVQ